MVSTLLPNVEDSTPKRFKDGTHRLFSPQETLAKVKPLLKGMGITRVATVTGLDFIGIHVAQAIRPNSRSLAVSQGKGLTLDAAKASALMESIESYHAERITLPLKLGSYEDLAARHALIDVDGLGRPKVNNYRPDIELLWIEGWDLLRREHVWLPYEVVHTNYLMPRPVGGGCFAASSNGLASGNHILEAVSHGICEVVERDANTLWNLSGWPARHRTQIDLSSVKDSACCEVLGKLRAAEVLVRVWETTSDVGIPSFICKVRDKDQTPGGPYDYPGSGCHPTREVALLRALTEAVQTRVTFIAGSRDDVPRTSYEKRDGMSAVRQRESESETGIVPRNFAEGPHRDSDWVAEDIRWMLERLQAVGVRSVVAVDLSKPELGISVARVVIPGMEMATVDPHFYAIGARGRQRLGLRTQS